MMKLVSFETPPLARQERVNTTTTTTAISAAEASPSNTCFHSHLDLSLGISLSRGGTTCGTASCGDSDTRSGGLQGSGRNDVRCNGSGITGTANVLSTEHGPIGDPIAGGRWATAFMPSPTGFMHPWSLAARQQKAVAEQERTLPATYVTSTARVIPLPSAVGWPPVHTSRRNLITAMQVTKSDGAVIVDGLKGVTMATASEKIAVASRDSTSVVEIRPPSNMFAKVHMEGYAIARKINLKVHGSYDSLSRVLTRMTRNFFCPADCPSMNVGEEYFFNSEKFIFLYEDFEGDRMLVGDVPWELFLASAKRLYIVRSPIPGDKGHVDGDKTISTNKATNN